MYDHDGMDCQECWDAVSACLDGEASAEERAAADAHLADCAACRRDAERAARVTRLARTELVGPTPDYVDAVLAALGAEQEASRVVLGWPAIVSGRDARLDVATVDHAHHSAPSETAAAPQDGCGCRRTCRCGCQSGNPCRCSGKAA